MNGATKLPAHVRNEIVEFLASIPNLQHVNGQRALVSQAGLDANLEQQIDFTGSTREFFQLLVSMLEHYGTLEDGRNALIAFLETAKTYIGQEGNRRIDIFIQEIFHGKENPDMINHNEEQTGVTGHIQLILEGNFREFNQTKRDRLRLMISDILGIDARFIRILEARAGSIHVTLEMPIQFIPQFVKLFQGNHESIRLLRSEFNIQMLEALPVRCIEFVNRVNELQFITSIQCPPYLLINAPSGYGKTRLLKAVYNQLQEQNWLCIYLDLANAKSSSLNALGSIILQQLDENYDQTSEEFLSHEAAGQEIGMRIFDALKSSTQKRIVFLVDAIESLDKKRAKKFLNQFIPAIQNRLYIADRSIQLRLILTGRDAFQWKPLSIVLPLQVFSLSPFDYPTIHQTVETYSTKNQIPANGDYIRDFAAHLMYFTGGHPGCMAEILLQDFGTCPIEDMAGNESHYYTNVVKPVIDEIKKCISRGLKTIFETLSVVRYFDSRLLKHFAEKKLIRSSKNEFELEAQLLQTHLVIREHSFLQDGITRRLLAIRLRKTRLSYFVKICEEAFAFYMARIQDPKCLNPDLVAIEILFQKIQLCHNQINALQHVFDCLTDVIEILKSTHDLYNELGIINGLINALEGDWEIRFMFNYFFKQGSYDPQTPFDQLLERLRQFQQDLQGGNSHA